MMKDLKQVLEGGYMAEEKKTVTTDFSENSNDKNDKETSEKTDFTIEEQNAGSAETENNDTQVEAEHEEAPAPEAPAENEFTAEFEEAPAEVTENNDLKEKYSLLETQYNELQSNYYSLKQEVEQLREFKLQVDNEKKDELISQFFMLSDEDKKDVIENKVKYTLDEIKSKLAVICFEKKVNFNLTDSYKNEDSMKESEKDVATTFNIDNQEDLTPDWVKEVELHMNGKL